MQDHYDKIAAEGQDKFTPVRATAVIGKWLESFPLIAAGHVPLFGYLSNPKAVETMVETSGFDRCEHSYNVTLCFDDDRQMSSEMRQICCPALLDI